MNMTVGRAWIGAAMAIAASWMLSSCGGGGGGGGGTSNPPAGVATWSLAIDPNPWAATITADAPNAVAVDMPVAGGTLSATAADGTVYTLTVPADALFEATRITMTPLSGISGLPVTGPAAGVELGPSGTQFFKPVTLTVKLPPGASWPIDRQIPVGLEGTGNVASLAALDPSQTDPTFKLMHFSSYAVLLSEKGMNSTLSQADVRRRFGGSEEQRLRSAAAEILGRERQKQLLGVADGEVNIPFPDLLAEYEEKVVKVRVAQARSSCAAARLALNTVLGHERQKALLGIGDGSVGALLPHFDVVHEICMKEEYEICRDEHILTRVLPILLGMLRQAQLLGFEPGSPPPGLVKAEDYTRKCLQFELQFDSSASVVDPADGGFTMSERVESRVKIGYTANFVGLPGFDPPPDVAQTLALLSGAPTVMAARGYTVGFSDACRTVDSSQAIGGQLGVTFLTWKPGENSPSTPGGANRLTDVGISLALDPNLSTFTYTQMTKTETGCKSPTTFTDVASWSTTAGAALMGQSVTPDYGAYLTGWQMVNSDIVATKEVAINQVDGTETTTGSASLVLFHTPLP